MTGFKPLVLLSTKRKSRPLPDDLSTRQVYQNGRNGTMTNEDLAMDIREGRAGYGPLWEQVQRHVIRQAYQYYTLH